LYVRQLINYNYNIVFTTLSAKAFSVSAPSVWNSLSYIVIVGHLSLSVVSGVL